MKARMFLGLWLGMLALYVGRANEHGWQRTDIILLSLNVIGLMIYLWSLWHSCQSIKRLAALSPEEQRSAVDKIPPMVKAELSRRLEQ
jgi:hypothetical protein